MMVRDCERRPGLRPTAQSVIDTVIQTQKSGIGELQLNTLLSLIAELPESAARVAIQRGEVFLRKIDEMSGVFENIGNPLELKVKILNVSVPERVSGTYTIFPEPTIRFSYNDAHSILISVGAGFISLKTQIEEITLSASRVDVDLSGLAPDKCFILT